MSDKEPTSQSPEQTDRKVIKISIENNSYRAVTKNGYRWHMWTPTHDTRIKA